MMTPYNNARGVERFVGDAASLAERVFAERGRWLIWGPPGAGKTTLMSRLARHLESADMCCRGIAADPGSPGFGVPGALALGRWVHGLWRVERLEPLCTLDAVRYRLPLVLAVVLLTTTLPWLP